MDNQEFLHSLENRDAESRRALVSAWHFLEEGLPERLEAIYYSISLVAMKDKDLAIERVLDIEQMSEHSDSRFALALKLTAQKALALVTDREDKFPKFRDYVDTSIVEALKQVLPKKKLLNLNANNDLCEIVTIENQQPIFKVNQAVPG